MELSDTTIESFVEIFQQDWKEFIEQRTDGQVAEEILDRLLGTQKAKSPK